MDNMSSRQIKFLIALALALPIGCRAESPVSKEPIAIRQTYADSSATELSCGKSTCTFSVFDKRKKNSYSLSPATVALRPYVGDYFFYPSSNSFFELKIEISCPQAQAPLKEFVAGDSLECYAILVADKGRSELKLKEAIMIFTHNGLRRASALKVVE